MTPFTKRTIKLITGPIWLPVLCVAYVIYVEAILIAHPFYWWWTGESLMDKVDL